jgi:hypothetical protein
VSDAAFCPPGHCRASSGGRELCGNQAVRRPARREYVWGHGREPPARRQNRDSSRHRDRPAAATCRRHFRLGLTLPGLLRLNLGPPRRNESSDRDAALDLLHELRGDVTFSLIPASRDARSASFQSAFRDAVLAKLEERATHSGRSGAPAEYRTVKKALETIRSVADELVLPLWQEISDGLPGTSGGRNASAGANKGGSYRSCECPE